MICHTDVPSEKLQKVHAEKSYLPLLHVVSDRPRGSWHFSKLASSIKSDFALKWGTFSSSIQSDVYLAIHARVSFQTQQRCFFLDTSRSNTGKRALAFSSRDWKRPDLREKRASFGYGSVSRRGTRDHDTLSPLLSPKPWTEVIKETAGITVSQKPSCNCLPYLDEKKRKKRKASYTSPVISFCRVSTAESSDGQGCSVVLGEFRSVFYTPCVTVTQVTAGPRSFCASWVDLQCCASMRIRFVVQEKCAKNP